MKIKNGRPAHPVLMFILLLSLSPTALFASEMTTTTGYKKQYTFTKNTFTDKIPAWTKLLSEFTGKPGINYLEIGTFEGRSALWILENILTHPTSTLTIIDAFEEHTYKTFTSNVNLSGEANKFKILSGLSTHKLRELPFNSFDLAYVDGSGIRVLDGVVREIQQYLVQSATIGLDDDWRFRQRDVEIQALVGREGT